MGNKTQQLAKAFDLESQNSVFVDLNTEQATEFLTLIEDHSAFLKRIRKIQVEKPNGTIGTITRDGNFLHPGQFDETLAEDSKFGTRNVGYSTQLVRGQFMIYDSEIRNNIEGSGLSEKLLSIIAKNIANDYEEMALYGRKVADPVNIRGMIDGVIYKAETQGNVVDATDTDLFADRLVARAKFRSLIKSLDNKYRRGAEFFVSPQVMMDYEDLYVTVADFNVRNDLQQKIAKVPTTECDLLDDEYPVLKSGGASTTVITGTAPLNTAGQKTLKVASATGVTAGDKFVIDMDGAKRQMVTVASVASDVVTLVENIEYTIANATTFEEVTDDGAVAILGNPNNIVWVQQVGLNSMTFEGARVPSVGYRWYYVGNVDMIVIHPEKLGIMTGIKVA